MIKISKIKRMLIKNENNENKDKNRGIIVIVALCIYWQNNLFYYNYNK